ncbi:GTP pyrophosphokinase [Lentilactobacillus kefiri]|jgi:putative GTP pyrophosphokinase|uniref:RelA SpoT domain-containing protein n=2 Tax=Lentilactobacillus kefiri TaxID=33962 RepID=A0A8E1V2Z4_LENKE|nr:GTP pyrophosphokinase [Lentilactobacillus kefiri]KRL71737.1 RelA SpoT domain-containing protein [Lentilactobacillus parakefiri DSM 10551]KRM53386.1 RelA SpoT domain-containing protein [Lentilactobacillus kefiri DSM 20587 = JCM 5818]MCJ2161749.1 GTP pyrophosphokinase family protein [Lentilactobacillus kefiri]MDH5108429.1 GTP pyrophosphokinase family protein [Lentilactobacillus kefiri]MDM7492926.1 GTP pyrophosphokinase family protein [Lentilactobacillus kefiri]
MILERNNFVDIKQITNDLKGSPFEGQVENLKELAQLYQLRHSGVNEIGTKLENLDDEYSMNYDHNPIHHMEERMKSVRSLAGKVVKKGLSMDLDTIRKNIQDIGGIRVITNYIDDVYRVESALTQQSDVTLLKRKDYIKNPKPSGYRSLHLVVSVPVFQSNGVFDVPVEVQLRTIGMDMWASLEHKLRYKTNVPKEKVDEHAGNLKEYAGELYNIETKMQAIFEDLQG